MTVPSTRESFTMVNFMVKEHISGTINVDIKVLGKITKFTGMEELIGLMVEYMKESI